MKKHKLSIFQKAVATSAVACALVGWAQPAAAAGGRADYDLDDDGLIEIDDLGDLMALHDPASVDGSSLYGSSAGCPGSGCVGFELSTSLDFDDDGSGAFDAGDSLWNSWTSIPLFSAIFEGNGSSIAHIGASNAAPTTSGLFAVLDGAVVRRVNLPDASIDAGGEDTGVLAGAAVDSSIVAVHASGQMLAVSRVGGLIGGCDGSSVDESSADVDILGFYDLGGLVGLGNQCVVSRSFATGRIASTQARAVAGGLVGSLTSSSIESSFATGNVGYTHSAGGLLGFGDSMTQVINSFATGHILGVLLPAGGLVGDGSPTVQNSFWATDTSGQDTSAGGEGRTLNQLRCPTQPLDGACGGDLYDTWGADLNAAGQALWSFGSNQQLPGLNIRGATFRDADGDATLDASDAYPNQYAAAANSDGDQAPDQWKEGCDASCRAASGLTLDQFPNNIAATIDLDLDGQPDAWNPLCGFFCRAGSGLTLDARPGDLDNDGILDSTDDDDNNDGIVDADADSDGRIDIATVIELDAMRYELSGAAQRTSELGNADSSGCPPRIENGVLARLCSGYELINDLDFDVNGNGDLSDDPFYNAGEGWDPIGRSTDLPETSFRTEFDGNGHVIYNLMIQRTAFDVGLFRHVSEAKLHRVGLDGDLMFIAGEGSAGALAAGAAYSLIAEAYSTGPVSSSGGFVGGLVGSAFHTDVVASFSTGPVQSGVSPSSCVGCGLVGGLIGALADGTVTGSFATGSVESSGDVVGGLVGEVSGDSRVLASYSAGSVDGAAPVGGLLGSSSVDVDDSYWATDASGQAGSAGNAVGASFVELGCPVAADDTGCAAVPLYVGWDSIVSASQDSYWDFGASGELPGLCLDGTVYRDANADGELEAPTPCSTPDLLVDIQIFDQFPQGYCATLTVTNTSGQAYDPWSVDFQLPETIYQAWNFFYTQNGSSVTATPYTWNSYLGPGQSTHDMGFCANY